MSDPRAPACHDCYDLQLGGFCGLRDPSVAAVSQANYVGYECEAPRWCPKREEMTQDKAEAISVKVEEGALVTRRELVQLAIYARRKP